MSPYLPGNSEAPGSIPGTRKKRTLFGERKHKETQRGGLWGKNPLFLGSSERAGDFTQERGDLGLGEPGQSSERLQTRHLVIRKRNSLGSTLQTAAKPSGRNPVRTDPQPSAADSQGDWEVESWAEPDLQTRGCDGI